MKSLCLAFLLALTASPANALTVLDEDCIANHLQQCLQGLRVCRDALCDRGLVSQFLRKAQEFGIQPADNSSVSSVDFNARATVCRTTLIPLVVPACRVSVDSTIQKLLQAHEAKVDQRVAATEKTLTDRVQKAVDEMSRAIAQLNDLVADGRPGGATVAPGDGKP